MSAFSSKPLVSIVTPFYNTATYLAECIESVLRQTYSNWEYILVDNCSTDGSAAIVEDYAKRYPGRIRLEHNPTFLAQVPNYNHALRLISPQSKYCKFVQADDWLFPQCVELMVEAAERDPSIGVVGAYSLEGRDVAFGGLPYQAAAIPGEAVCRLFFLEGRYLFGSPTQLLLRSDLVLSRTPFYDESYIPFEDAAVVFDLLGSCSFGFVHQVLTFSRRENGTLMSRLLTLDCLRPFQLYMLRQFGRNFLTPAEYRMQLKRQERAYAQLLMEGLVALRDKPFWEFHGTMLKRMGYSFKYTRAWWLALLAAGDVVLNPKWACSLFLRSVVRHAREAAAARRGSDPLQLGRSDGPRIRIARGQTPAGLGRDVREG